MHIIRFWGQGHEGQYRFFCLKFSPLFSSFVYKSIVLCYCLIRFVCVFLYPNYYLDVWGLLLLFIIYLFMTTNYFS